MLRRFSVSILEEGGRLGLKCLLLSYFRVGDYSLGIRRTGSPVPMVRLTSCCDYQWLILCSPNQKPQDNRWLA
jgi:hypothetical protein